MKKNIVRAMLPSAMLMAPISAFAEGASARATHSHARLFMPDVHLVVDGRFSSFRNDPELYELPGFALGGEAGLSSEGLAMGHSELTVSTAIGDALRAQFSMVFADHDGDLETDVEEAFFELPWSGQDITVRGGRFMPGVGYINQQHEHVWDFADAPLVYAGLWGNKYIDDGVHVSWMAPTSFLLEWGAEALAGGKFPAGDAVSSDLGAQVYFVNVGGDAGKKHSWRLGASHYRADVEERESGGHHHGGDSAETPEFTGDSDVDGVNAVYQWAPAGNFKDRHVTVQGEYFRRDESGVVTMRNSGPPAEWAAYTGNQHGFYVQAVYQFMPQWRFGVRYDKLRSDNHGSDVDVLGEAGLNAEGISPERHSVMLAWDTGEFGRFRLQCNRDASYADTDHQLILQYTVSLGDHDDH